MSRRPRPGALARVPSLGGVVATTLVAAVAGCYSGARATADISAAWQGRTRAELEAHWGAPASHRQQGDGTLLVWSHRRRHVELPVIDGELRVDGDSVEARGLFIPGRIWTSSIEAAAILDPGGTIVRVEGRSLRWGPPNDANIRWSVLLGFHAGMGRLDDTSTPLPSGGLYIGGMLRPTLGLVGTFSLVAGTDSDGPAMGFVWGLAAQYWPETRLWVRAGPAAILAFDPGFENIGFEPGVTTGASYALVKAGSFVLDLRLDLSAGPSTVLGNLGVGVNLN
ncbi:hypothetical protein [Haliangium sp.]|uniref:hypothetical protein n=1 Tax=Haliangium sp. TaxID=2663208 RepID=UPI003D1445EA